MRAQTLASAVAVIAITSFSTGAFAAQHSGQAGSHDRQAENAGLKHALMSGESARPRLAEILSELHTTNDHIDHDKTIGAIDKATELRLKADETNIENKAKADADQHHGRIPDASFSRLQAMIGDLKAKIASDS